ncbi:hypothetical protein QUS53_22585, partial [Xanthomonas citri pv. citri]
MCRPQDQPREHFPVRALNVAAAPGNSLLEPAAGLRQVNAADTSVAFLFAALDHATALQRIQ